MKVIIPVAGIGSRLRPHTHTQPKTLVPLAGKALLSHIIDTLVEAGCTDFIFVIGYLGDKVEDHIRNQHPILNAQFVIQEPRQGIGHALWLCKDLVGNEPILIVLGDIIFDGKISQIFNAEYSTLGVRKIDNPGNFGVVVQDENGWVTELVEKPRIPKSNLGLIGIYKFIESQALMNALEKNIQEDIKSHGEFQLTDGIQGLVNEGVKVGVQFVESWYDCGSKDNLLEANANMLKRLDVVPSDFIAENSILIPPVSIATGTKITNSIIGPNVSIGENTIINSSILSDAIIGSYAELNFAVLNHSIVGSDASLKGMSQSLNIGDSTEIHFV